MVIGLLDNIYGAYSNENLTIRIYNDQNCSFKELIFSSKDLYDSNFRLEIDKETLSEIDKYGMYTFFSEYPGFFVYSLTENENGSIAIEHGF